ncbi:hypothetical protein RFI_07565 [Reticulomyxa filosa]|uniref:V-type proton ATPase subunit a n=1 Tax=Reticulomyxa filosa TaxID=46433 RepID=X6NWA2_RETFI|nr:hypothetical protein RFI_07565 [Reticulomyxa filosa]|eukprot:ETO29552.1 hypothetical protein RFI_07565 [Reticulomyxa filosa]
MFKTNSQQQMLKDEVKFSCLAGVVTTAQRASFERQVFLTSRGNSLVRFKETKAGSSVFAIFFLGSQLQRSLKRLCQFMNIQICYESDSELSREILLEQAKSEREEDKRAHVATRNLLVQLMNDVAGQVKDWKATLLQAHGIHTTMNRFRAHKGNSVLRAEGWCPSKEKERLSDILEHVVRDKGVGQAVLTDMQVGKGVPPTYFEENDFTTAFQQIVDTYGVPRYKEFNPAVPTIITFPFLFGVMYGDIFHGSCLLLFSFMLYVLLFMGIFSTYCGVIYNDCLSIMINGWNGSQWQHGDVDGHAVMVQRNVYAVGIDPAWSGVDNQLAFANSLKMKLSVIIGVGQMTYGLFVKLSNHLQERDYLSVYFEFVPQLVFMLCFFGYMVFLIFYKWCLDWTTSMLPDTPSLITVMIKMFLAPGTVDQSVQIFPNANAQAKAQMVFLVLLMISVPVMLCVKPCILKYRMSHQHLASHILLTNEADVQMSHMDDTGEEREPEHEEKTQPDQPIDSINTEASSSELAAESHSDHEESFGDIMIHQLIHTIEYVLGTISNTASYLRLWALSLAHAELSEVFFSKTLGSTLASTGAGAVVINVASTFMFLMFTFCVLLVMDVLECFLHALRLHWVEFQNKFYYGDGRAFQPFSFATLIKKHNA